MEDKPLFSGTVKEYTEERYVFDKKGNEVLDFKYVYKYEENGKLSEVHGYNSKNRLVDIGYYSYDSLGNLSEMVVKSARGKKKQHMAYEYVGGRLSQVTNKGGSFMQVLRFDANGNLIEEEFYRDANAPPYITKYKNIYDDNNRLVEKWIIVPPGEIDSEENYTYDKQGLLVEEHKKSKISKNSVSKHIYNDRSDRVLSEFHSEGFGREIHKREIKYNEFGDITQIQDYRKGYAYIWKDDFGLISVTKYTYVR